MTNLRPVLLAEDDANDVFLVRRALRDNHAANPLHVVANGQEAIDYLDAAAAPGGSAAHPFPALFLLDLKMPGKDGLAVLQWLGEHREITNRLPVVVLSSSELPVETQAACAMDIQSCIIKPLSYSELRERIRILKEYWLDDEPVPSRNA